MSVQTRSCLAKFAESMSDLNGALIPCLHNAIPLESFLTPSSFTSDRSIFARASAIDQASIIASDASDIGHCSYSVKHGSVLYHQGLFTPAESSLSSGHRELLAVLNALRSQGSAGPQLQGRHVLWLTDSTNLCVFLTK